MHFIRESMRVPTFIGGKFSVIPSVVSGWVFSAVQFLCTLPNPASIGKINLFVKLRSVMFKINHVFLYDKVVTWLKT
jgi:hypothetical protein